MRMLRVYVDTSVFGGVHDIEFAEPSRRFFESVRHGQFIILVSQLVLDELAHAPAEVLDILGALPVSAIEPVRITEEMEILADLYLAAGVVGVGSKPDALYVAIANVSNADLIPTWALPTTQSLFVLVLVFVIVIEARTSHWRWHIMQTAKTEKSFDCFEFKRQAQARLMAEYEARRKEFGSFRAFVEAKTGEDDWSGRFWKKLASK